MKKKGIPKDTLTMQNIRRDLRRKLWKSWRTLETKRLHDIYKTSEIHL